MTDELIKKLEQSKNLLGEKIVEGVIATIKDAKENANASVRTQADRVGKYFDQLLKGKISKDEFNMYMEDIKGLLEMEALQVSVESKVRVNKFIELVRDLVVDNLDEIIKLLK